MKALIAMSGGVDSSVAACLIHEMGWDCVGITMKLYHNEDIGLCSSHTCCSLDDVEDARAVAYKIGIPYYVFNFTEKFRECVIDPFISAYENGMTPNPCIACNRYLKFEKLYQRAKELGCDKIVTGHYARIQQDPESGKFFLKKAVDLTKDQSYVLYNLNQDQLAHTLFPLGDMTKAEAREIALAHDFINARKHDSQDICFAPDGDYVGFMERFRGKSFPQGDFVDLSGKVIGKHKGIVHYTIGQHRGLGADFSGAMYVCAIDPEKNQVVLGPKEALFSREAIAGPFHWVSGEVPAEPFRCKAKIRYRHTEQWATAEPLENGRVRILFDEPQRAITPGQAAVLYDEDIVLGGGPILRKSL